MVNESELMQIKNEFLHLAKKCGVQIDFYNTENDGKLITPLKSSSPMTTTGSNSTKKSVKRKRRRSYADKMLSELANECSMTSSLLTDSFNDDDDAGAENMMDEDKHSTSNKSFSSHCTSYRKAIDLNPLFSFTADDKITRCSSVPRPRTLRRCDRMPKMVIRGSLNVESSSGGRLQPEGDNIDQCDLTVKGSSNVLCNINCNVERKNKTLTTETFSIRERLQPEGAESEPEKHTSLGFPGVTPISESNTKNRRASLFKQPSLTRETIQGSKCSKDTVSCKRVRSSRSSRSSSSKPLASSTMIDSLLEGSRAVKPREIVHKTPMLKGYPSVRRRLCYYPGDITKDEGLKTISDQCSLELMEPLSVIEPANRDGLGVVSDTICDEHLIERPTSIPRTSTKVDLTPKQSLPVVVESYESDSSPPCSFYTLPSSSTLRDTYLETRFHLPERKLSRQSLKHKDDFKDCKIELSSIVSDSIQAGVQFKRPTGLPPRKPDDDARRRHVLRRTSTPLPSTSPLLDQDKTSHQAEYQNTFDKKSLSKRLKKFRQSFSRVRNAVPEIKTLARV